jgi:DNA replication protein DnaC
MYLCPKCKDREFIIYRVHKDSKWITDPETGAKIPENMVPEEEFFSGKFCSPEQAWEWRQTFAKRCSCVKWKNVQRLFKASQITEEFRKLGFKNFITEGKPEVIKVAYDTALEYFQNFDRIRNTRQNSIALLGQPGSGKTHLLTAIANNLMRKKEVPVLYFPYVEGFNDLRDDFDKLEEKLERMKMIDVLFIDDLFKPSGRDENGNPKPKVTDWQIEQLYAVINYRYLNYKPILVSSELTVDELADVDEALGTRIYEMCSDYTVVIKGDRKLLNHRLVGA